MGLRCSEAARFQAAYSSDLEAWPGTLGSAWHVSAGLTPWSGERNTCTHACVHLVRAMSMGSLRDMSMSLSLQGTWCRHACPKQDLLQTIQVYLMCGSFNAEQVFCLF